MRIQTGFRGNLGSRTFAAGFAGSLRRPKGYGNGRQGGSIAPSCGRMHNSVHAGDWAMNWDAHLNWSEEIFAMLVVLPAPIIFVALLWYFAPRLRRGRK
jgi:hypothetical protein